MLIDSEETHIRIKEIAIALALEYIALRHGRMKEIADNYRQSAETKISELVSQPANFGEDVPNVADVPHIVDDIETGAAEEIGGWDFEDVDGVW